MRDEPWRDVVRKRENVAAGVTMAINIQGFQLGASRVHQERTGAARDILRKVNNSSMALSLNFDVVAATKGTWYRVRFISAFDTERQYIL